MESNLTVTMAELANKMRRLRLKNDEEATIRADERQRTLIAVADVMAEQGREFRAAFHSEEADSFLEFSERLRQIAGPPSPPQPMSDRAGIPPLRR